MHRASSSLPIGGGGACRRPRLLTHRQQSTVAAAAGKKQKSGAPAPPPSLPPSVRAEGELSDRERALLEAAVRDSQKQQSQQQQQMQQPKAAKKGFAASSALATAPAAARPIDPREAARGRVELVNVRSWGGGSGDAGDLEVVSMRTLVGGGAEGQQQQQQQQQKNNKKPAGAAATPAPPFTAALAQQLQLAEARGALSIASSSTSKPLPPFEKWSFSPRSYAQYLADHAEAHAALDEAVDAAVAAALPGGGEATATTAQKAARCLRWFSSERGIARGDAYASDLRAMVASMQQEEEEQQQQQPPQPSNGAAALARLLRRLGRDAASSADDNDDGRQAALKLAAHAYALRAAHLSGSGRITAAAEGRLGLAKRGALAAVARYEGKAAASGGAPSPPAAFSADVDAYGREMMEVGMVATDEDVDEPYAWARPLFAELPPAFRKASALLDGLATTAGG